MQVPDSTAYMTHLIFSDNNTTPPHFYLINPLSKKKKKEKNGLSRVCII